MTKNEILNRVSDYEIFNFYLRPFHNSDQIRSGLLLSNPFLHPHIQKTPSFNIYKSSKGTWFFNDFATGDWGDCFTLVMQLFSVDFKNALVKIQNDFNL